MPDPSLARFRKVVAAGYAALEARRHEINDLNVFPVADGDTGDNMAMTMRAVLDELDRMNGQPVDEIGRDEIVHAVTRASLLGARGNSGVILSQIVRGAAEELVSRPGELVDPVLVSAALARAADAAYDSVREPAEGTMLSAVRAMAHRVARDVAHMDRQRLGPDAAPVEQDELLARVLDGAREAGTEAVEHGPDQLAALRDAGVVDAGALGLMLIIAGMIAALRDEDPPPVDVPLAGSGAQPLHLPQHESSRFRFCTNFVVTGDGLDVRSHVPALEEIGDCALVVGDRRTMRVHVHTDDPGRAVAILEDVGEVSHLDVADMREQAAERTERLGATAGVGEQTCLPVVVANGEGLTRLYEALGAVVVDGGPTLNPSTYDLLAGIHAAGARECLLLPNSPNVVLAAERAAELSEKPVHVVPIHAQQVGLSALLALDPSRPAAENAAAVTEAAGAIRQGGVARAARDDVKGRFAAGAALGYVDGELVAWGEPEGTLRATLGRMSEGCELVTCVEGADAPLERAAIERLLPDGVELDHQAGGQAAWWWLLCAE